jgi:hypothetical protein
MHSIRKKFNSTNLNKTYRVPEIVNLLITLIVKIYSTVPVSGMGRSQGAGGGGMIYTSLLVENSRFFLGRIGLFIAKKDLKIEK